MIAVSTTEDQRPRHVVMKTVAGVTKAAVDQFVRRHIQPASEVYSDGLAVFDAAVDQGHAHTIVKSRPRLAAFSAVRRRIDPRANLQSATARRLGLAETAE